MAGRIHRGAGPRLPIGPVDAGPVVPQPVSSRPTAPLPSRSLGATLGRIARRGVLVTVMAGMLMGTGPVSAQAARLGALGGSGRGVELSEVVRPSSADARMKRAMPELTRLFEAKRARDAAQYELTQREREIQATEDAIAYWKDPPPEVVESERWSQLTDDQITAVLDAQDAGRDPFTDGTIEHPDAWKDARVAEFTPRLTAQRAARHEAQDNLRSAETALSWAEAALGPVAAEALAELTRAGLAPEVVAQLQDPGVAVVVSAFAEAWATQRGVTLAQLPAGDLAFLVDLTSGAPSRLTADLDALLALPPHTIPSVADATSASDFANPTASARAAALRAVTPLQLGAEDYRFLAKITDAQAASLVETLRALEEAVGVRSTGYQEPGNRFGANSELTTLANLDALRTRGLELEQSSNPERFLSPSVTYDWAQLMAGAKRLHALTGQPFTFGSRLAAGVLGAGTDGQRAELEALIERTSGASSEEAYGRLARLVLSKQDGLPKSLLRDVDATVARLGRAMSADELGAFIGMRLMGNDGQLMSERPKDAPAELPIKDFGIWAATHHGETAAQLRTTVQANLHPGARRTDNNARYDEDPSVTLGRLSHAELLKVRALQRGLADPATRDTLAAILARDLANGPVAELGGLVVLGEAGRATFQDLGSLGGNDAPAYAFPFGTHSPWRGLALFHLHAVDAAGNPTKAGPSSGRGGLNADIGAARETAQDGVVITLVAPGQVDVDFYTTSGVVLDLGVFSLR
ncbi:MAG: hypothetical protein KC933_06655 [Myxococcales bacterium]|nr:hypothetical protein [Myxococcales bacterium]